MRTMFSKGDTVITPSGRQATVVKSKPKRRYHPEPEVIIKDDETSLETTLHPAYLQLLVGRKHVAGKQADLCWKPTQIRKYHGKPPAMPSMLESLLPMSDCLKPRSNGASSFRNGKLYK